MFLKIEKYAWLLALLLALSCNRPNAPATPSRSATAPFSAGVTTARSDPRQLSSVVAQIMGAAHRSGSVIYRVECGPERSLAERDMMPASPTIEPMKQALEELSGSYPGLKWDDSAGGIRVLDGTVTTGLLKVRIPEFTVVEDRDADTALTALWRTPEVIRYMEAHDLRFAHSTGPRQTGRRHGVVVVHMKSATVEEIVQRIAANYPNNGGRVWSYRECQRGTETLVEIKIL